MFRASRRALLSSFLLVVLFNAIFPPVLAAESLVILSDSPAGGERSRYFAASNIGSEEFLNTYDPTKTYEVRPVLVSPLSSADGVRGSIKSTPRNPDGSVIDSPYQNTPDSELSAKQVAEKYGVSVAPQPEQSFGQRIRGIFSDIFTSAGKTVNSLGNTINRTAVIPAQAKIQSIKKSIILAKSRISKFTASLASSCTKSVSHASRIVLNKTKDSSMGNWLSGFSGRSAVRADKARKYDAEQKKKMNELKQIDSKKQQEIDDNLSEKLFGNVKFKLGPIKEPKIQEDNGFLDYFQKRKPTIVDYGYLEWWKLKLSLAKIFRKDLAEAEAMYAHFIDRSGKSRTFSFKDYVAKDPSGKVTLSHAIQDAKRNIVSLCKGRTSCEIQSDAYTTGSSKDIIVGGKMITIYDSRYPYPQIENWQKTIGAIHFWSEVKAVKTKQNPNIYVMRITIHAQDRYNFKPGAKDITTGIPDGANGRFEVTELAKQFMDYSTLTTTVSWDSTKESN